MTTPQVALKGLERCLVFVETQRDSQSSFYSSGIESLQQVRELAAQVCIAANDALAKVGLDEPQSIVKSSKSLSVDNLEDYVSKATEQAILRVFNQLNVVNQQNISIDISTIENPVNRDSNQVQVENLIEPVELQIQSDKTEKPSNQFMSEFKGVLHKVSTQPLDKFKYSESKEFADLASEYFDVRFSRKYDKSNIHWFSQKRIRDYLASLFLSYCESVLSNKSDEFVLNVSSWLESIKETPTRYTLPGNSSLIFFDVLNKSEDEISTSLGEDLLNLAHEIWDDLWVHGYFAFTSLRDSRFCPTASLNWIQPKLQAANDVYQNSKIADIAEIHNLWVELAHRDSYDLLRALAIKSSPLLQTLNYDDNVNLSDEVLHEALQIFVNSSNFTSFEDLKLKISSINALIEVIDHNCKDIADSYEYVKDLPPEDLDLVEVLECYASANLG